MTTATDHTVVALYDSRSDAERAVDDLFKEGFSDSQISFVTNERSHGSSGDDPHLGPIESTGSGVGPGTGIAVGSIAGFFAGLVALAIPGIGPILAVGPLTAGVMGATAGAAVGGITGALKRHGVDDESAERFSQHVAKGGCLVTVHAPAERASRAAEILDNHDARNVDDNVTGTATTGGSEIRQREMTPELLEAYKLKPGEGLRDRQRAAERRVSVFPGITGSGSPTGT